jgi:hypothetical protein
MPRSIGSLLASHSTAGVSTAHRPKRPALAPNAWSQLKETGPRWLIRYV